MNKKINAITGVFFGLKLNKLVVLLILVLGIVTSLAPTSTPTQAATSSNLNFQARLLTSSGRVVDDGYYNIEFKLYTASSGGSAVWTETWYDSNGVTAGNDNRLRVVNGYVTVNLGAQTAFGAIDWDQEHWLTMNIGGTTQTATPTWDGEMTPRLKLTAVPYAFKAGQLAKRTGANTSTLDFATQTGARTLLLPDESGTLCIQNSANCGFAANSGSANYIQNQNASPQTADFNISGTATVVGTVNLNITGASTTNIANGGTGALNLGNTTGTLTIQGGASSTIALGGTTIDATELNRLDGKDAALLDVNDAVNTAIIGTGALSTGSIAAGFGTIQTSNTITGTTVNGTTGINTGAGAGTQRIDASGNLVAVGNITAAGATTIGTSSNGDITINANGTGSFLVQDASSFSANLTITNAGSLATGVGATFTTAGTSNNAALNTASFYLLDTVGAQQVINGITAGRDGQRLTLTNTDAALAVTLANNSGAATGAKIITGTGSDLSLRVGASVSLIYDSTNTVWRVEGTAAIAGTGTGAAILQGGNTFGSTVDIGTNDNFALNLRTNNTTRVVLSATGDMTFQGNNTVTSTGTLTLDATGTLTVGSAATSVVVCNTAACDTIQIGTNADADAIQIGDALDTFTLTAGAASTFVINGVTVSAAEFNLLDGRDTTLLDLNDAVTTAITGTGALASGSIASGFGTISTTNTITGTTVNGTTGINTGAGAGTQRIDASGNLVNIADVTTTGNTTLGNANTDTTTINGTLTASNIFATTAGTDYSTTGQTNNVDFGSTALVRLTGASAQSISGIANGSNGRRLTFINAGANAATLLNNSGSSSGDRRIITGTGANLSLPSGGAISLVYDGTSSQWRVDGGVALPSTGTGAPILQGGNSFGAAMTLGTNDGYDINFETNGTTRLTLDTSGNLAFQGNNTISSTGSLSIQANNTSALNIGSNINTGAVVSIGVSTSNNGGVQIGTGTGATAVSIGRVDSVATGTQIKIGTGITNSSIYLGGVAQTGAIYLGQSTVGQAVDIANATTSDGNVGVVRIATSAAGTTGRNEVTIGSTNASSYTRLQGGTGSNAITLQTAGGTINIGTTSTPAIGLGNTTGTLTIQGGASSTIALGGTTIDATELNRLDGKDAALLDVNDAVNTAIIGTGALSTGSIAAGFGTIQTSNTITGTTVNGTTGINTGAGAGTQRIDASGNLVNIVDVTTTGNTTLGNANTDSTTINGSASVSGSLSTLKGTDYSTTGTTNDVNLGTTALVRLTGASAQTITGITGGTDGRRLTLINAGSTTATIANNSGSSVAANRITTGTGADLSIPVGSSIELIYDITASLWRTTGSTAFSSGNFIQNGTSPQTANFNIQSAATGSVAAVIAGASGQTADILRVTTNGGGTNLLTVSNTGNTTVRTTTDSASTFNVQDQSGGNIINVVTNNPFGYAELQVGGTSKAASLIKLLQSGSSKFQIGTDDVDLGGTDGFFIYNDTTSTTNFALTAQGSAILRSTASDNAFQVQNPTGTTVINVDSNGDQGVQIFNTNGLSLLSADTTNGYVFNNGITVGNNLVENPGFEASSELNGKNGWFGNGVIQTSAANAHTGNKYAEYTANSANGGFNTKTYAVTPGETVYLEGWVYSTGNGQGGYYLEFRDKDYANPSFSNSSWVNPGATWTKRTIATVVPAGMYYMSLNLTVRSDATTGVWRFDDIYFKKTTEIAPVVFKNSENSTSAFQIQNSGGASLFVADTTNTKIEIAADLYAKGLYWVSRTNSVDNDWKSVAYGNGIFVAVAESGTGNRIMTSSDGVSWITRTSPVDSAWQSVTYGNGLFVAVANAGTNHRVMTSVDGISWTSTNVALSMNLTSITYGNGRFVAVASNNLLGYSAIYSTNGTSWNYASGTGNEWNSITYGNGLFVAVSDTGTGNRVMTSPDGVTWTTRTSAADNEWNSITYGNGLFVAVSDTGTGNRVMTSPDGVTWTTRTSAADNEWNSITYGNGLFVAVSDTGTGNRVMTSGKVDQIVTSYNNTYQGGMTLYGNNTVYGNSLVQANSTTAFQVQNTSGNSILTVDTTNSRLIFNGEIVTEGLNWQAHEICCVDSYSGVAYGNGVFVFLATSNSYLSQDGKNWRDTGTGYGRAVTYGNGIFVGVGDAGDAVTSIDGENWTARTAATANNWTSITYGNGLFVAVSDTGTGNRVMTSPNGVVWTSRTSAADNNWTSVTYGNGLFVAVAQTGTGNRVMTSPDGITWTIRTSAADNNWQSVTYGKGRFIAVANTGTGNRVMTSLDGITWATASAPDQPWQSVTYGNNTFVAVSEDYYMTSSGSGWVATAFSGSYARNVMYHNGIYIMNGTNNYVYTAGNLEENVPSSNNSYQGGITVNGNSLFRSDANSTTAFQIQNASGQSAFTVNTSTQQVAIGPAAVPANGVLTVGVDSTADTGGIYFGTDVSLYRSNANELRLGSGDSLRLGGTGTTHSTEGIYLEQTTKASISVTNDTSTDASFRSAITGDTNSRFFIQAAGNLRWGPGNAAGDVELRRDSSQGQLILQAVGSYRTQFVVQGTTSQSTSDLMQFKDSNGYQMSSFGYDGRLQFWTGGAGSTVDIVIRRASTGILNINSALELGEGSSRVLRVEARSTNVAGNNLTVAAGAAGTGASAFSGGQLNLRGGDAAGTGNANGGNVVISGGTGTGTGVKGSVVIDTPTFATVTNTNCGTSCTITQANVDGNGAIIANATAASLVITLPDPTITTAGKIVYVTAANGSQDFTLRVNGGGTGNDISMRQNTTATMVWNGSDWTAAGASSSTTLQAAYANTLTSAGGAELVLNAPGGNADGLTIRNNDTTPITGGILEVQSSIGTNLFSVNNLGTELAANGGAETSATFSTNWTAAPAGGTITRTTTAGQYVTGQAGVQVVTAGTNHGVRNNLSANPVVSTTYTVSFAAKLSSGTFTTLDVQYSRDGGTDLEPCTSYSTQTLSTSVWTKVTCTITTDGTTATNPDLIIRQTDATGRTFWIDNLSFVRNDATTQPSNVQIGGGISGGQVTLFTLDRASAPPVANGDTTYLGSMYYDTVTGRIQCYESDGWGACGSAPDNIITLTPEYAGAVLGDPGNVGGAGAVPAGVGTMSAEFCSNQTGVIVVGTLCASGEARNYYKWTSPQASQQTYSVYVNYKLPNTYKAFSDANTIKLTALATDTTLANATLQVFRKNVGSGTISSCGSATQIVTNGNNNAWQQTSFGGDETACGFTGGDYVIFKIDVRAYSNASVYIENLDFTYTNR